jgi:tRNA G10  N-methylase Trm11
MTPHDIIEKHNLPCTSVEFEEKVEEIEIDDLQFIYSIHNFTELYGGISFENTTNDPNAMYYVLKETTTNYKTIQTSHFLKSDAITVSNIDVIIKKHIEIITNNHNKFAKEKKAIEYFKNDITYRKSLKNKELTKAFEDAIKLFECSCGIKMDATVDDMRLLRDGIEYIQGIGGSDIEITDYHNEQHLKTIEEAKTMLDELRDNFFVLRNKKISLREDVENSTTIEEIEKISW